jgi:hypothetical protein
MASAPPDTIAITDCETQERAAPALDFGSRFQAATGVN